MKRHMSVVLALLLGMTALSPVLLAQEAQVVDVSVVLERPDLDQRATFQFEFIPIDWKNGEPILGPGEGRVLPYDPQNPAELQFDLSMTVGKQYQLIVDIQDEFGNPLQEGIAYYYDSGDERNLAVNPGEKTILKLDLSLRGRAVENGNFLDVWQDSDTIVLTLYPGKDIALTELEKRS